MARPPLNGTKTHPLTAHAKAILIGLSSHSVPAQEINPGVINRLERESLISIDRRPSPYKSHAGKLIDFAVITQAGRNAIAKQEDRTDG